MRLRACIRMLLAVGVVLAAASAAGAGKKQQPFRPFWGSSVGEVGWEYSVGGCPPQGGYSTISEAEGEMTHLGRTTTTSTHCAGGDEGLPLYGMATFTAANGDKLFAAYVPDKFKWLPPVPPMFVEEGEYLITGGTGRFQNASGRVKVTVFVTPTGDPVSDPTIRWPAEFVFVGTISY